MARSLPKGIDPWQTLHVDVVIVRGRAEVRATVRTSFVTGVVDTPHVPKILWEGVVHTRKDNQPVTPEEAADWAHLALNSAFPQLF